MTMALEGQVEAQKQSQNILHSDQETFMKKLGTMRTKLQEININYDRKRISLWNFGNLTLPFHHGITSFPDNERKQNLGLLIHALLELELELHQVISEGHGLKD
jgi:hypothetical protein